MPPRPTPTISQSREMYFPRSTFLDRPAFMREVVWVAFSIGVDCSVVDVAILDLGRGRGVD